MPDPSSQTSEDALDVVGPDDEHLGASNVSQQLTHLTTPANPTSQCKAHR